MPYMGAFFMHDFFFILLFLSFFIGSMYGAYVVKVEPYPIHGSFFKFENLKTEFF